MKRFWTQAYAQPDGNTWRILLDSRPMRLPQGGSLVLRDAALATAVAAEWQNAGGAIGGAVRLDMLPLTCLAATAEQRIGPDPVPTINAITRYGETDLLCYRADAPNALVMRQAALWQPWLDWAKQCFGADLRVVTGITHVAQDAAALAALRQAVAAQDVYQLTALGVTVPALGSVVLGLAVAARVLPAAQAVALSLLDDIYQAEFWGEDYEAIGRHAAMARDVADAAQFAQITARAPG